MIRAWCNTADDALVVAFDATPWLREADPQSIGQVAANGWSSERVAEALERRPGYEGLQQLIEYASSRLGAESLEDPAWATFHCSVDAADAKAWLAENRPEVLAFIHKPPIGMLGGS
jgi:hypothetical protein